VSYRFGIKVPYSFSQEICVEPRDKRELKEVMNRFYMKNAEPGSKGAVFMAVCRGKVRDLLIPTSLNFFKNHYFI